MTKNLIELNGKKYDTVTGEVLTTGSASTPKKPSSSHNPAQGSLDGFVTRKSTQPRKEGLTAKGMHYKASKSKTLMRSAVHRPAIQALQETIGHLGQLENNAHVVADHKRALRAKTVTKSNVISRFGSGTPSNPVTATSAMLPVRPAPINPQGILNHNELHTTVQSESTSVHQAAAVMPKKSFSKELESAQSHTQPKLPKRKLHHRVAHKLHLRPRIFSVIASTAVVVLLAGFFTFQYHAYAAVKMAAARSGVPASLPAQTAGFSLSDKVRYKPGEVSLAYKSNSDDRNFTVTQAASSWNSDALEENFIASLPTTHSSTLYPSGKTVFTYGSEGSNATWVSGGIWYKVEGNSALTSSQLQNIINSM